MSRSVLPLVRSAAALSVLLALGSAVACGSDQGATASSPGVDGGGIDADPDARERDGGCASCTDSGARPAPVVLVAGRKGLQEIAVAGARVIWTEFGSGGSANDGAIMSCSVDSHAATPDPIAPAQPFPSSLALDTTRIFWADRSTGGVKSCALEGPCGAPVNVVSTTELQWGIAVATDGIYFTLGADENGSVGKCPLQGCSLGAATTVASAQNRPQSIVVSNGSVYWVRIGTPGFAEGAVVTCPATGCGAAPTVLSDGQLAPLALAVDGTHVYWTTAGANDHEGAIHRCPRTGCGPAGPTTLASGLDGPGHLALDSANVYWTELGLAAGATGGRVAACPLTGCSASPIVLATDQGLPRGIAVDTSSVYWVNGGDGRVMKTSK